MKLYLLVVMVWAGLLSQASAQTTQPAQAVPAWEQTVKKCAGSLTRGDEEFKSLQTSGCTIHAFDGAVRQPADLIAYTSGSGLLLAKAYGLPANSIAGDIGSAVANSQVSDEIKRILVPAEGDSTNKANATASKWVKRALDLASGDSFAVLVFFTGDVTHADNAEGQVLFVLLKAKRESDGSYLISHIVFGDPHQATASVR